MFHILEMKILPEDLLIMTYSLFLLLDRRSEDSVCNRCKITLFNMGNNLLIYCNFKSTLSQVR